jgi:hypothetical protein
MGHMDMLGKFFKQNNNAVDSNNRNIGEKFYLKPYAERDFFAWVNQWSIMIKKPSDIGFSDDMYTLPSLVSNTHIVKNNNPLYDGDQGSLFTISAATMSEVREEQKATVQERCERSVELAQGKTSVYWCNLNAESSLLSKLDSDAVEIIGGMSLDKKEDILLAFASGEIKRIITKPKMTSMGLNWQHCAHTTVFPTWSYEQLYQLTRRFWRFGQENEVTRELIISDGQSRVLDAIDQKTEKAKMLYENLVMNVNDDLNISCRRDDNQDAITPSFI